MRLSSSSVFGFSTRGERGESPPPPPGVGFAGWGFCIRSGIKSVLFRLFGQLHQFCKLQNGQILHRLRGADHFQALFDEIWIKQVSQIKLDLFVRAVEEDVVPTGWR